MVPIIKPYLLRASLFAGFALVLGILLSLVIYFSSDLVRENSIDLVKNRMPVLASINQVIADISEQERIVYEYYTTQNNQLFNQSIKTNRDNLYFHSQELTKHPLLANDLNHIRARQENITVLINEFDQVMQLPQNNWNKLRNLLAKMSQLRREMLPILHSIEQKTKSAVEQGHTKVLSQMNFNHQMVIIYGVSLVLLAAIVAWYIKQYVLTNAQNSRLALFPKLNPNPILSVNNMGELVFNNPACDNLLADIGLKTMTAKQLIPNNFNYIRQQISQSKKHSLVIEKNVNGHVLQLSINWLAELDVFDIHILDITENKRAEQKINHLAFYVQATNLPNQYKLSEDVENLLAKKEAFSFSLFEIRNFNRLVTAHSVEVIDELIKSLTKMIYGNLPEQSYLYQLDKNHFALLSYACSSINLLNKLVTDIEQLAEKPLVTQFGEFFIELDFGLALSPSHGEDFSSLYKNAHTALNIAAADKYHNSIIYKTEYAQSLKASADMLAELRYALERKELFLVFQPQLDLLEQRVSGIETLVRWQHQDEIVSPVDFIPLAEQSGLIVPIGQWILVQACIFAKSLIVQGYQNIIIAVNVSPRQFSHPDFVQSVIDALKSTQLPAKNLELEITEGVFMHNETEMLTVLNQLKSLGLQLSIDDFGTGYSSLSYLKKFPIDKLKIDQSFIRDCHENNEDKALVRSIVALGQSLGMSLIAEGVEEYQHLTFLQGIGCDEIQGYWFSKPLVADDLLDFLAQSGDFQLKKKLKG
jgi:EAL domain-containing protein (putative c-di-GMP-specific phosphodiesterase class I)/GGDEF domain-containing protein